MSNVSQSIKIGKPYIEETPFYMRLCVQIDLKDQSEIMWFSVDRKYGAFLTYDRADAFAAAVLTTAMHNSMDIICEAPITKRLLYQFNHYLIPMMAANMDEYHPIKIFAEGADTVPECAGAVATGWTGGVDSMYTLMRSLHTERKNHRLTHLLIANNGALEGNNNTDLLNKLVKKAERDIAAREGLSVIGVDTNLQEVIHENFRAVISFRQASVVLALQGLFGMFLSSASCEFSKFSFDVYSSCYYELASLSCFETDCTVFYSAYGAFSRIQKLRELSDFLPAQNYLHPCIYTCSSNCGKCEKCIRTEVALFALGTLEKFSSVFDVKEFEKNKDWYLAKAFAQKKNHHYTESLALLEKRGIKPSANVKRMARILSAADHVVEKNREWLSEKLIGE